MKTSVRPSLLCVRHAIVLVAVMLVSGLSQAQSDSTESVEDTAANPYIFNQDMYMLYADEDTRPYQVEALVSEAQKHLGTPYVPAGKTPGGFDCTGFLGYIHRLYGVYLPFFSWQFETLGTEIALEQARKGDLVLFRGQDAGQPRIGHAGLVVSSQAGKLKFIHASNSFGVRYDQLPDNAYFRNRYAKCIRLAKQ